MKKIIFIFFLIAVLPLSGCTSIPKQSVELAEISEYQIAELQKSHLKIVGLYYDQRREEINIFIDTKWMPTFLAKTVQNPKFRDDLDSAYQVSNITIDDLNLGSITWKNQQITPAQKAAIISGIKTSVTEQRGKLGETLMNFSEAALTQINKKRNELLNPINAQESMVLEEISAAYTDLQRANASIKGYLASAVELKEKQDQVLEMLDVLDKKNKVIDEIYSANDNISKALKNDDVSIDDIRGKLEGAKSTLSN
jgi:hypothetical protein